MPIRPGVSADPADRLAHAAGESLPDWIARRAGRPVVVPDAVAHPGDPDSVRSLLEYAATNGAVVVPRGGGTSVVGGVTPTEVGRPVLVLDLLGLSGLRSFDPRSGLATFGAGTTGPAIEAELGPRGWMLGHLPQSWARATLGGWVAARSVGQQSLGFGRIEALFAGGRVEAPAGTLVLPSHPASAAGPDLRQLVLGSEGRYGVITEATVRAVPLPERERFPALFLPDWEAGLAAVRTLVQARLPLAMVRLSGALETSLLLALGGRPAVATALAAYFRLRRLPASPCLLLLALAGRRRVVAAAEAEARAMLATHGAERGPGAIGRAWVASRYRAFDLRAALWTEGYAVDTIETAADWSRLPALADAVIGTLRGGLAELDERVIAFGHLSHVYGSGSSLYVTYVFRTAADPDETHRRWHLLKTAASRAIVAGGGTISHQHGVGTDHLPYLEAETGSLGIDVLDAVARTLDPPGIMNPGVLIPPRPRP
ncbi:MAG TPA: FAD-binding oxidoreductase [Candidatus Limnocylindrales bacterium]|nr:FAD-binding oxidoreductase [Candidatus Limnocylindrales bacterium]